MVKIERLPPKFWNGVNLEEEEEREDLKKNLDAGSNNWNERERRKLAAWNGWTGKNGEGNEN